MDSDFWTSRLATAKRHYALQNQHQTSHLDQLNIDDFDVEDEVRPEFPCPFCYEDFDVASLCSHLEDDHSCESKVTVCPICSIKISRDMLSHIKLQHGYLFKLPRRCRLRRVAIPNSQALSILSRDLQEAHLHALLGGAGYKSNNTSASSASTDPFLSSLILNFPASEAEEISKSGVTSTDGISTKNVPPNYIWKSSLDPSLSYEERQKRIRQASERSGFMQDLLLTTLLGN